MTDWPDIEKPLCEHLDTNTTFPWAIEGGHTTAAPLGIVQVTGGGHDLDQRGDWTPDVEITLRGATRDAIWTMARQVNAVLAGLNPGGIQPDTGDPINVDEVRTVFGLRIDPDQGTSAYRVATATYNLVLRPQVVTTEP